MKTKRGNVVAKFAVLLGEHKSGLSRAGLTHIHHVSSHIPASDPEWGIGHEEFSLSIATSLISPRYQTYHSHNR